MLLDHVHECRAAGSGHLLAFFLGLRPLKGLISCRHITAESDFVHIVEADLLQRGSPAGVGDVRPELSFSCRCHHGNDFLACIDQSDQVYHEGF